MEIDDTKKAVLLFVPFPLLGDFRKIQKTLVEELEKKLTGYHVLIIANRTMIRLGSRLDCFGDSCVCDEVLVAERFGGMRDC